MNEVWQCKICQLLRIFHVDCFVHQKNLIKYNCGWNLIRHRVDNPLMDYMVASFSLASFIIRAGGISINPLMNLSLFLLPMSRFNNLPQVKQFEPSNFGVKVTKLRHSLGLTWNLNSVSFRGTWEMAHKGMLWRIDDGNIKYIKDQDEERWNEKLSIIGLLEYDCRIKNKHKSAAKETCNRFQSLTNFWMKIKNTKNMNIQWCKIDTILWWSNW